MTEQWQSMETTTHQDHVIAHVIGTTVLGHIVLHDAVHLLLDIGFIWKIYVEGDMGLLPHPVAVAELEISDDARKRIVADIDLLMRGVRDVSAWAALRPLVLIVESRKLNCLRVTIKESWFCLVKLQTLNWRCRSQTTQLVLPRFQNKKGTANRALPS